MGSKVGCIPKLDFSHLEPGNAAAWDELKGEMMSALESYGCFEVVYDKVSPDLRDALFGRAWPEMFDLPTETKLLSKYDLPSDGYIGQIPGFPYQSFLVKADVEEFARKLWPQGNPTFCNTVSTFIEHIRDLERIVVRMIFLGLGIEKYYDSYTESSNHGTRASEYGISLDKESKISLTPHVDPTIISIVGSTLEGLEIQTKEGEWIPVEYSPDSFTVIIGETIQAWTNGRIPATIHRVRHPDKKRYSMIFGSVPKDDSIIKTPKELVDEEHPLVYKPYVFREYMNFRYSDGGGKNTRTLYDYCGIREEEPQP